MTINLAYLELRLSGGAANADPAASLGGVMSSQRIYSKAASGLSHITGVVLDDAPGVADGTVTLEYVASTHSLRAVAGGSYGAYVAVAADGRVAIPAGEGYLFATVTYASLPGTSQSDTLTVAALANALFDDIGKAESYNGDTEYRCCYIHNAHPTDAFLGTQVYIASQPTGADALAIGLDGAGLGNGATTGVAATVADESTAPAVTFAQPASIDSALFIGQLNAGEGHALWQRRTVPALTLTSTADDRSRLLISVAY